MIVYPETPAPIVIGNMSESVATLFCLHPAASVTRALGKDQERATQ